MLKGEVKNIVYTNSLNGYTVIEVSCGGAMVTAVGIFPPVHEGELLEMEGDFVNHKGYGRQFKVSDVKVSMPTSQEAMKKYLSSGLIKGLGEVTAANIVNTYGSETFEMMNYPMKLAKVKGISLKKATEFGVQFQKIKGMQDAIIFLQKYSITINLALKIYKTYEGMTQKIVSENPYRLVEDIDGVGFFTADKIALEMGIPRDSNHRISAAVIHLLKEAVGLSGHTYLPISEVVDGAIELLRAEEDLAERVQSCIDDLYFLGDLKLYDTAEHRAVMLARNYETEKSIAARMHRLLLEASEISDDMEKDIERFEMSSGITLHGNQKLAIMRAIEQGVQIITGGPGTGKTTIVKAIIHILKNLKLSFVLCAPTGRAAKRLSEATGEEAKTIHRLLDLDFTGGKGYFTYNEQTRIPADIVIVDEVSMVDEYVFNSLIKALERGTRLILVGDKDQLPSVGAGNVLADLIASDKFSVTYLTEIYRQEKESLIVVNAHEINKGRMFRTDNSSSDFFYKDIQEPREILNTAVDMCIKRLPEYLGIKPQDIQILSPMKKGLAGVNNLNDAIQNRLNPKKPHGREMHSGEQVFREGDKVMQIVNNYQQEWVLASSGKIETGVGVYNGDIGYIQTINNSNLEFTIRFEDDKVAVYSFSDLDQIVLAYAVTVHKSQGSEFDVALITVTNAPPMLLTRNLLYTAVTRAKKMVVILGDKDVLARMVKNNYTARRYSLLKQFLEEEFIKNDEF